MNQEDEDVKQFIEDCKQYAPELLKILIDNNYNPSMMDFWDYEFNCDEPFFYATFYGRFYNSIEVNYKNEYTYYNIKLDEEYISKRVYFPGSPFCDDPEMFYWVFEGWVRPNRKNIIEDLLN